MDAIEEMGKANSIIDGLEIVEGMKHWIGQFQKKIHI